MIHPRIQERRLANGLRTVLVPDPNVHDVSFAFLLPSGSRYEPARRPGLAHLMEHLLFNSTRRFPTEHALHREEQLLGGSTGAWTSEDWMHVSVSGHRSVWRRALRLLDEVLYHPVFTTRDLRKEQRVVAEELRNRLDSPWTRFHDWSIPLYFGDHPRGRPAGGTPESVARCTLADVRSFHQERMRTSDAVFTAAGNFDPATLIAELSGLLADARLRGRTPRQSPAGFHAPVAQLLAPTEQALVKIAFPLPFTSLDARWYPFAQVLWRLLGIRLFEAARKHGGLTYEFDFDATETPEGANAFHIQFSVHPGRLPELLRVVRTELARLKTRRISARELADVKRYTLFRMDYLLDDAHALAWRVASHRLLHGNAPIRTLEEEEVIVRDLSPADVQGVARAVFRGPGMSFLVMAKERLPIRSLAKLVRP